MDPIQVPRIENRYLESEKMIIMSLESEKIGTLKSEKSGPYRSISYTQHFS